MIEASQHTELLLDIMHYNSSAILLHVNVWLSSRLRECGILFDVGKGANVIIKYVSEIVVGQFVFFNVF